MTRSGPGTAGKSYSFARAGCASMPRKPAEPGQALVTPYPLLKPLAMPLPSRGSQGAAPAWRLAVQQSKAPHRSSTLL